METNKKSLGLKDFLVFLLSYHSLHLSVKMADSL